MKSFDNPARIEELYACIHNPRRDVRAIKTEMIRIMSSRNKQLLKKLFSGRVVEEFTKDVAEYQFPNGSVIVKSYAWDGDFPGSFFQEIASNIMAARLVNSKQSRNFVRMYDVFVQKDTLFMLFEKLQGDVETIENLEDQSVMWDLLFQMSMAVKVMQETAGLVHFDLRHDNVLVEHLDAPVILYPDLFPYETRFVAKVADLGLSELNVGSERPENDSIPRGAEYEEQWGVFPLEFAPGYDLQYFVYTQVSICDGHDESLHGARAPAQFYILNNLLDFIDSAVSTEAGDVMTANEYRPRAVSGKTADDCVKFLIEQHELI